MSYLEAGKYQSLWKHVDDSVCETPKSLHKLLVIMLPNAHTNDGAKGRKEYFWWQVGCNRGLLLWWPSLVLCVVFSHVDLSLPGD
jgi:hypothetical protein